MWVIGSANERLRLAGVLTWTGLNRPTRIIWTMPIVSLRSVLLMRAERAACMWRVSTQIAGSPASTKPA